MLTAVFRPLGNPGQFKVNRPGGYTDRSRYTLLTRTGEPATTIAATTGEVGADCVVLGGYRHRRVVEFLFGSTVDAVVRQVELPIIIA